MSDINNQKFLDLMMVISEAVNMFSNNALSIKGADINNDGIVKYALHLNSFKHEEFENLDNKKKNLIVSRIEKTSNLINSFRDHKNYLKNNFIDNAFLITSENDKMKLIVYEKISKTDSSSTIH